jgi:hypothetical protein
LAQGPDAVVQFAANVLLNEEDWHSLPPLHVAVMLKPAAPFSAITTESELGQYGYFNEPVRLGPTVITPP